MTIKTQHPLANQQTAQQASTEAEDNRKPNKQAGFTLIEMAIVMAIIGLLALVGVPRIQNWLIEGKVKPTADGIAQAIMSIRINAQGQGNTPYTSINTAAFANTVADRSNVLTRTGSGTGATLQHTIGATGSQVTVAPATITTAGDAFTVTLPTVSHAACPDLASILNAQTEIITINGTVVKSTTATPAVPYNGQTAQNACTNGNTNTFVFTAR